MSEPYLGEIRIFPWDWAPQGWAACDGSKMDLWQYQALYAIIGTAYGGDGQTYFQLPNLRGKAPMNWGTSAVPGISAYTFNQTGGANNVALTVNNLPSHDHNMNTALAVPTTATPAGNMYFASLQINTSQGWFAYKAPAAGLATVPLNQYTVSPVGAVNPTHANQQPFLALNFCICLQGTWPMRPD